MSPQARKARVVFPHKLLILSTVFFGLCLFFLLQSNRVFTQVTETCVQPPPGIIAWWPFDETSGTTAEDIIGGHNGVHINDPVPTPGKVGGALRFDGGSSYVGAPDSDLWAFGSNDFTIELWANWDSPGSGDLVHAGDVLIGNDEGPGLQNKWFFALGGGLLHFTVFNELDPPSNFFLVRAPFSPAVGQWYHLGVTKRGSLFTIYIDGIPVGSEISAAPIANPDAPLIIGQSNEPFGGFMNGLLDEVTIYNRALTQGELQGIFNAGSAGKCKALSISTKALSAIQLGVFSTQKLEARFGSAPFNWSSLVNGDLPSGMTLTSDGVLSGTPTVAGSFPVTIRATDSLNAIAEKNFVLDVLLIPPPSDIRIHKVGTTPVLGRVLDYFIVLENNGTSTSNLELLEILYPPEFLTFSSAAPLPKIVVQPGIVWDVPMLLPGETRIFQYSVKLSPTAPLGVSIPGAAQVVRAGDSLSTISDLLRDAKQSCQIPDPACLQLIDQCRQQYCDIDGNIAECMGFCVQSLFQCAPNCGCKLFPESKWAVNCKETTASHDPNEKLVIAKNFIQPDQLLVYPIHFENIGNAEARDVFVTDGLDPNLDASTLNLLTPTGGSFDLITRTVRWDLLNTNLQPGATGNVLLSIRPRPGLPSGTVIRNSATIQFEVFQPIVTNEVINIIDSTRPTSIVNPLPAETSTLDFPISWSGSDAIGEIDFYSILVSVDGGNFTPFLERTRDTNATFRGEVGKTYGFLAIATDTAGNIEVQSATAETSTRIVSNCATGSDNQPPTITGESASPAVLWPPNHTMWDIAVDYTAADNCPFTCTLSVTSNEPINGTGDGDTEPDSAVVDAHHVRLRAERAGTGSGRFYTITITCTDGAGNSTSRNVTVYVAHNFTSPANAAAFKIGPAVNFTSMLWDLRLRPEAVKW